MTQNNSVAKDTQQKREVLLFNDIESFAKAVEASTGRVFDFVSLTQLTTNFTESTDQYLILNVKGYDDGQSNYLIFATEDSAFLYTKKPPPQDAFKHFEKVFHRPFGLATVLTFLTLNQVLAGYKQRMENLISRIKEMEETFDSLRYHDLMLEFDRFNDTLEEFHDLLLRLEERMVKQVETRYISFDYRVLIAESLSLQARCRRRLSMVIELERDYEIKATTDLNKRIEGLNDVVKRLTALTVILMIPTLIASHFGMNFQFMPELRVWWAYPVVIAVQALLMIGGIVLFRKWHWF